MQRTTALQCNVVSHWLSSYPELYLISASDDLLWYSGRSPSLATHNAILFHSCRTLEAQPPAVHHSSARATSVIMEPFPLAASANRSLSHADDTRWVEMEVLQSFHDIFMNMSYEENFTAKLHTVEYSTLLDEFKMTLHTYTQLRTLVLISFYVPVFLCAFFGNIIVLMVVLPNRHMRSVTNCFIVNLAVADILGKSVVSADERGVKGEFVFH